MTAGVAGVMRGEGVLSAGVVVVVVATWCWLPGVTQAQFVPGFLVESGTDLQEWPQDLAKLFPKDTSPEEQHDFYANAVAQVFQAGTIAAPLPDHNPVEAVLGGPVLPNDQASPEYPGMTVLPNGTAIPAEVTVVSSATSSGNANGNIEVVGGNNKEENTADNVSVVDDGGENNDGVSGAEGGGGGGSSSSSEGQGCGLVAFSVARAHYKHRKAGTKGVQVLFDKVLTSEGPGFNHSGGYFRCQCPGLYLFSLHGVSPLQGRARLDLMRNRQRVASTEAQYYGFGTAANTVIIRVYKNDILYIYLAEGFLYENDARFRGYASFTGYKIG